MFERNMSRLKEKLPLKIVLDEITRMAYYDKGMQFIEGKKILHRSEIEKFKDGLISKI